MILNSACISSLGPASILKNAAAHILTVSPTILLFK